MFLQESGVIFPFPESKKLDGGKSILMNFFESFAKNPTGVPLFINLKKF